MVGLGRRRKSVLRGLRDEYGRPDRAANSTVATAGRLVAGVERVPEGGARARRREHTFLRQELGVLKRLLRMTNQDGVDQLTPCNWKKAREQSLRQAA